VNGFFPETNEFMLTTGGLFGSPVGPDATHIPLFALYAPGVMVTLVPVFC